MRFGIAFANAGPLALPENAVALATLAEDAGFESLWTVEHVVIPAGHETPYPYSRDGRMPGGEDVPVADPLTWLAFVAGATKTIKLATGILILPQRNPLVLAKEAATVDILSGGRLILGVGIGWLKEEFEALGVPFQGRASRAEEYIEAMRSLWSEHDASFRGDTVAFEGVRSYPKPARPVPIVIGGHSDNAARRAGRLGDGFFPGKGTPEDLARLFDIARASAVEAGRDPNTLEFTAGGTRKLDKIKALEDLGVTRLTYPPLGFDLESLKRGIGEFHENIASKLA